MEPVGGFQRGKGLFAEEKFWAWEAQTEKGQRPLSGSETIVFGLKHGWLSIYGIKLAWIFKPVSRSQLNGRKGYVRC